LLKGSNIYKSTDGKSIYIFAIIDTLTYFGAAKKFEYIGRRFFQSKGASCVPPTYYAERFKIFMQQSVFFADSTKKRGSVGSILDTSLDKNKEPQRERSQTVKQPINITKNILSKD